MLDSVKTNLRQSKIKSATLDIDDLIKSFEIVKSINEEALKLHLDYIDEFNSKSEIIPAEKEIKILKEKISEKYVVGVEIQTQKGRYIQTFDPDEAFDKKKIPDDVIHITISNTILFGNQNEILQLYQIKIDLDFTKPALIDFTKGPSYETSNQSVIGVWGLLESWVDGVHDYINKYFEARQNKRAWIHKKNMYDLIIWSLIIPIIFWNMYKIDIWITPKIEGMSSVFTTFLFIYLFIIGLLIFNLIFRYLRYAFPPVELKSNIHSKSKVIPKIITLVIIGYGIDIFRQIISWILDLLL